MAFGLPQQLLCLRSPQTTTPLKSLLFPETATCSIRPRNIPPSPSPRKRTTFASSRQRSSQEPKLSAEPEDRSSEDEDGSSSRSFGSISTRFRGLSERVFKFDGIVVDILSIALPAALSLAADPITSLVDTAFVGHIGSAELAAVGVSVSVFNLIAKFFNVPLLNVTTSFVAEEQASLKKMGTDYSSRNGNEQEAIRSKKYLPSVSASLSLALILGVAETVALSLGSGFLTNLMGISPDSPMWEPTQQFLTMRAFGAPPIVVALAAQGAFRGFMDTKTPLYAVIVGNLLNAILDPILIFNFGFGISGAAIATVISEYLIAAILMWKLSGMLFLMPTNIDGRKISRYLASGGLLIGRSIAVLATTTLATSIAAREGPTRMAGHQIVFEVWLAISLLTDALALAGQALLANVYSQKDYEQARLVTFRILQISSGVGCGLSIILFLGFRDFSSLFTTDSEVLDVAWSGLLFVAGSQPMNALAFVFDGLYYGVSDFGYSAYSMVIAGIVSSVFMLVAAPTFGLAGVWSGLFLFMTIRVVAGFWRLGTKTGPWEIVWRTTEEERD